MITFRLGTPWQLTSAPEPMFYLALFQSRMVYVYHLSRLVWISGQTSDISNRYSASDDRMSDSRSAEVVINSVIKFGSMRYTVQMFWQSIKNSPSWTAVFMTSLREVFSLSHKCKQLKLKVKVRTDTIVHSLSNVNRPPAMCDGNACARYG